MKIRLKGIHPDLLKVEKLDALARELGISFEFGHGRCHVTVGDKNYQLEDIESPSIDSISEFPHPTEWKLTYEKVEG